MAVSRDEIELYNQQLIVIFLRQKRESWSDFYSLIVIFLTFQEEAECEESCRSSKGDEEKYSWFLQEISGLAAGGGPDVAG